MDRNAKNDAWEQVAKTVGCDVRSAENKMKIMKTHSSGITKRPVRRPRFWYRKYFQAKVVCIRCSPVSDSRPNFPQK
jgi:hypothetical protein